MPERTAAFSCLRQARQALLMNTKCSTMQIISGSELAASTAKVAGADASLHQL